MDHTQKRIRPIKKAERLVILRPVMGCYLSEVSWEGILIMENRICTVCKVSCLRVLAKSGFADGSKVLQAKGAVYTSTDRQKKKHRILNTNPY